MTEFITALNKCQTRANLVLKNKSVSAGARKYNYADLSSVMEHFSEVFVPEGFAVSQLIENETIRTILFHKSGENIESVTPLYNDNNQNRSQGLGSAITYARRYALCAICGIVADEDDDGELTARVEAKAQEKQKHVLDEWLAVVREIKTPKECHDLLDDIKPLEQYLRIQVWGAMKKQMIKAGIIFNEETKEFLHANISNKA